MQWAHEDWRELDEAIAENERLLADQDRLLEDVWLVDSERPVAYPVQVHVFAALAVLGLLFAGLFGG